MQLFLLVLEAKSKPAVLYEPFLDVLERRLGAKRILRSAWVVEGADPEAIYDAIRIWFKVDDGLVIVPYGEVRVERNLRS
jgi:hypothetical protein